MTTYWIAFAEPSPAGQLRTVYNMQKMPLFTFIALPGARTHFVAAAPAVEPGELAKALAYFGVKA